MKREDCVAMVREENDIVVGKCGFLLLKMILSPKSDFFIQNETFPKTDLFENLNCTTGMFPNVYLFS